MVNLILKLVCWPLDRLADYLEARAAKKAGERALAMSVSLLEEAGFQVQVVPGGVAYVRETKVIPFRQKAVGDRFKDREMVGEG